MAVLGIKQHFASLHLAMCNMRCVRVNGVLKTFLDRITKHFPKNCDLYLHAALLALSEIRQDSL